MATRSTRTAVIAGMVVLLALPMVLLSIAPSSANWYGESGYHAVCPWNGNITDNKDVYFKNVDPAPGMVRGVNRTRSLMDPQLRDHTAANLTSSTDVVTRNRYYTDWCEVALNTEWTSDGKRGLQGITACYSTTSSNRCQQQVVRISKYFFKAHGDGGDNWIVCHEVGHAFGLVHRSSADGCMLNDGTTGLVRFTPHDRHHLGANWNTEPRHIGPG